MKKKILEEEIYFCDKKMFGDEEEHCYDVECYDGHAVGRLAEDSDAPKEIKLTYPKRKEVLKDEELSDYILKYRGLYDLSPSDITYGDIMIALGEIER